MPADDLQRGRQQRGDFAILFGGVKAEQLVGVVFAAGGGIGLVADAQRAERVLQIAVFRNGKQAFARGKHVGDAVRFEAA